MASTPSPIKIVSPQTLRSLFNGSQYPHLIATNQLSKKVIKSRQVQEPILTKLKLPPGTKSEIVTYRDSRKGLYVLIHQYLKPDGTLGASGKQDPKSLLLNGIMYKFLEKVS